LNEIAGFFAFGNAIVASSCQGGDRQQQKHDDGQHTGSDGFQSDLQSIQIRKSDPGQFQKKVLRNRKRGAISSLIYGTVTVVMKINTINFPVPYLLSTTSRKTFDKKGARKI
jgi:hypothetical protein